jgi:hypothetical protein
MLVKKDLENLWQEFYHLYTILHKEYPSNQEID